MVTPFLVVRPVNVHMLTFCDLQYADRGDFRQHLTESFYEHIE